MADLGGYRLGAFIGRGASGEVHEAVDTASGERVAVKLVDCRRFRSVAEIEAVQEEAALLRSLRHRHIIRLLGVSLTPTHICFVMEHAGGGTLDVLLKSQASAGARGGCCGCRNRPLTKVAACPASCPLTKVAACPTSCPQEGRQLGEPEVLRIFTQIVSALEHCHRRCIGG